MFFLNSVNVFRLFYFDFLFLSIFTFSSSVFFVCVIFTNPFFYLSQKCLFCIFDKLTKKLIGYIFHNENFSHSPFLPFFVPVLFGKRTAKCFERVTRAPHWNYYWDQKRIFLFVFLFSTINDLSYAGAQ